MQVRDRGLIAGSEPEVGDTPAVPGPDLVHETAGKREVDLYGRTYATLLRSSGPVAVDTLVAAHLNIQSSLHAHAAGPEPDMNAFMYSTLRLPPEIVRVNRILLGQSPAVFARHGYTDLDEWTLAAAPGRRRRWRYDGHDTLAVYVGSMSDLDDLIPTIVAWQIEWNKLHARIRSDEALKQRIDFDSAAGHHVEPEEADALRQALGIGESDWA